MVSEVNSSGNPQIEGDVPQGCKRCSRCGEIKALDDFTRHKSNPDGHHHYCRSCKNELERRGYLRHKEHREQKRNEWKIQNQEKVKEIKGRYEKRNPIRHRKNSVQKSNRRRSRKKQLMIACPSDIGVVLLAEQNNKCLYCQCDLANDYHLDHIIPIALADLLGKHHPGHVPSNLALACPHCNVSKNDALLENWLQRKHPDQMDEILRRVEAHIARMREWDTPSLTL